MSRPSSLETTTIALLNRVRQGDVRGYYVAEYAMDGSSSMTTTGEVHENELMGTLGVELLSRLLQSILKFRMHSMIVPAVEGGLEVAFADPQSTAVITQMVLGMINARPDMVELFAEILSDHPGLLGRAVVIASERPQDTDGD